MPGKRPFVFFQSNGDLIVHFLPMGFVVSNWWVLRQSNDARPTVSIAARAFHVTERNSDRSFGIARLHAQIEVHDHPATIAVSDQPVMTSEIFCL